MTYRVSVLGAATVAVAGSLALVPVATAEPDSPYSVTVVGSTDAIDGHVQVTITKPAGRMGCQAYGVAAGSASTTDRVFNASSTTLRDATTWSWGFVPVPDGVYDVYWGCRDTEDILWGSFPTVPEDRRQEPVRNVRVSHDPNATVNVGDGGSGSIDFGSLTSGSADGGFIGS